MKYAFSAKRQASRKSGVRVEQPLEGVEVHVALERVQERGHLPLFDHEVAGLGALHLDVGAGRVEVVVVRHDLPGRQNRVEQDSLGGPPLMRGDHVRKAGEGLHGVAEPVERAAAGVRFVALHERAPLRRRHRASARVRQQVDEHVVGVQEEHVEAGRGERHLAVLALAELQRLHGLDAERLDDRVEAHAYTLLSSPRRSRR